ncbi:MAG: hypothetical protein HY735_33875 [Verrucomicrobia bacterium]|nr:hypothetical protein [Verrucomicrobiota bacterium]
MTNDVRVKTPTSHCRFGLARCDITPPVGIYHRFWGAASHDRATGVHRPLTATVAIFEPLADGAEASPGTGVVLIALDHCLFWPAEMEQVLQRTSDLIEIERARIIFAFSHTHSAGNTSHDRIELPGGELIPPYMSALPARLTEAYRAARLIVQPAVFTYGSTPCRMGHNRDFWDAQLGKFVCGFNPAEATDLEVGVVRVTVKRGVTVATFVNYPCHPTTLAWENTLISPDYVGALRVAVEKATRAPCVFLLAPCGDIGPRVGFVGDFAVADQNGRQVAYAALSALEGLPPPGCDFVYRGPVVSGATLGDWRYRRAAAEAPVRWSRFEFRHWEVAIPYRPDLPSVERLEVELRKFAAAEAVERTAGNEQAAREARAMAERKQRWLTLIAHLPQGSTYPMKLWAWRLGDAVWLAVIGEPYHWLQAELQRRFPNVVIVFAAVANGWASYLPEKSDYGKSLYQVEIALLEAGCLETVAEEFSAQIRRWFPE